MTGDSVPGNRWDLAPAAPAEPARVSVVVSHYRQPDQLRRTLRALERQDHPADRLEVVVADDGSPEPPDLPPGVRLVRQADDGFRVARVRNLGAAAATGDVLVFLDADTTPEPGFVRALTRLPALLPEAVVVGRRRYADLAAADPDPGAVPVEVAALGRELPSAGWLDRAWADSRNLMRADELSFRHVLGGVLACTAGFFAATGGFDETFTRYGGEDWEWAHRAWTHGAVLAHEPAAVAWHDGVDRSRRPGWGVDPEGRRRMTAEAADVAERIPVPGVAPHGLLTRGADPVVTADPGLRGEALCLALDSLLLAWPRARVLLGDGHDLPAPLLADPRLVRGDTETPGAWRHLHLERAVRGEPSAWRAGEEALRGPDAAGSLQVTAADGGPALTWTLVRAEHRRRRWGSAAGFGDRSASADLHPVDDTVTLPGAWGGWQ